MNKKDLKEGQEVYVKGRVIHTGDHLDIVLDNGSFIENAIILHHEKPVIPRFVADWYEEHKDDLEYNIWEWFVHGNKKGFIGYKKKFLTWLNSARGNPIQTLVNMHQLGYEVEKEKRYLVKMKGVHPGSVYLKRQTEDDYWYFGINSESECIAIKHTRKELEEANFGWVFDCPGIEIEELEE